MIDLHSHILPGVDDGASSLSEAVEIAREAEKQGVDRIVATPHYLEEGYQLTPGETQERVAILQQVLEDKGIDVEILPGAEVFLTKDLGKKVHEHLVSTVNESKYIMIELPVRRFPDYVNDVFYDLKIMGYIPVIVHPERYEPIREHPNYLYHWIKDGIYAQLNASSLLGVFGTTVKKTAELLVKHNMVQVLGSDVHNTRRRKECMGEGVEILRKIMGDEITERYLKNAENMVENRELDILEPIHYESQGIMKKLLKLIS